MKVKDLAAVLENNQYVELLDPDPMNNLFGGEYEGNIGNLNSDYYDNCEVIGTHLESRIIRPENDDRTILITVMEIYIKRGD